MDGPKPQRQRKAPRKKKTPQVDIKVTNETTPKKQQRPRRKQVTVVETTQGDRVVSFRDNTRQLRRIQKQLKKLKKEENGPTIQSVIDTKLTLGTIQGVAQEDLDRQMRVWMSPVLAKPRDVGSSATPLTMRACQYNLYKILSAHVVLTPLVGKANVAGTIILVDIDQESSAAKPDSIDSVKARSHVEVHLGQQRRWNLPKKTLVGPRDGWWYVDTSESPTQSMGPALNFWTYLSTLNLLGTTTTEGRTTTTAYTGPLFLAEMQVKYAFSNYNPKPALSKLYTAHISTESGEVAGKLINGDNEEIILEVRHGISARLFVAETAVGAPKGYKDKSDIVTSVVSTTVEAVAGALGPWGWLLKGGWFLVRKIFNLPASVQQRKDSKLNDYYSVYSSIEDAMRDQPIRANVADGIELKKGFYNATQVNTPDLEDEFNSPIVKTVVGYNHDWLPVAKAPMPELLPPPIYQYDPETGYTPGIKGETTTQRKWNGYDSRIQMAGPDEIYWFSTDKELEVDFDVRPNQPPFKPTDEWSYVLKGKSYAFYNFTNTGVFIGERADQSGYGVMHSSKTMIETLKKCKLNVKDEGRPWQIFQRLWDVWSRSHDDKWEHLLKIIYQTGEDAWAIPVYVDSGLGWSRLTMQKKTGDLPEGSPVDPGNMRAQGIFIININSGKMGMMIASNDPKVDFQSKVKRENTLTAHNSAGNTQSVPIKITEWPLVNRDSDIDVIDEDEEFVAVRRKYR